MDSEEEEEEEEQIIEGGPWVDVSECQCKKASPSSTLETKQ